MKKIVVIMMLCVGIVGNAMAQRVSLSYSDNENATQKEILSFCNVDYLKVAIKTEDATFGTMTVNRTICRNGELKKKNILTISSTSDIDVALEFLGQCISGDKMKLGIIGYVTEEINDIPNTEKYAFVRFKNADFALNKEIPIAAFSKGVNVVSEKDGEKVKSVSHSAMGNFDPATWSKELYIDNYVYYTITFTE